ncbi:MAG: hypothetical protein IJ865_08265, partial [Clostridia bacterium]|nr:hypothetical protein [Clostridia bacterium]
MRSVKAFMYAALMLMLLPVFAGAAPEMVVSGEYFQTGDVVDLVINDGEGATAVYTVFRDEVQIFQGTEDTHLRVSYRPRTEGSYRILADLTLADGTQQAVEAAFTVEGERKEKLEDVYSQRDGWWADRSYRTSTLEHSGCAIFALSHALSRMGVTDAETMPASLGVTYASCLITGGTSNVRLISQAAQVYNYETQSDLISSKAAIQRQFDDGAMFSFAIVSGHIALADAISEDGSKVRVVDSAPGVTQERIKGGKRYWREESGAFRKISDLSEIDECRYYLETAQYGGLIYWLDLSYVAQRGVRLIKPYQVSMHNAEGTEVPVKLETFGTAISQVQVNGKSRTIPTEELSWRHTTEN